eukprot:493728_1
MDQTHHPLRLSLDFDIGAESGYQKASSRNAYPSSKTKKRITAILCFVPAIKDQMVFVVKQPYKLPVESCHICTGRQSITPDILALSSTPNTSHSQLRHQIIYVLLTV